MAFRRFGGGRARFFDNTQPASGKVVNLAFKSIEEMATRCDGAHKEGRGHGDEAHESFVGRKFRGWADARDAMNAPWQEGLDAVQEMLFLIKKEGHALPVPTDRKRRRRFSEDGGDDIDNDRLRSGQQDYWIETRRKNITAPQHVTIVSAVTTSAYRSWESILWRGVVAMVLSDLLEDAGFRVELHAVNYCTQAYTDGSGVFISCCLKESGGYTDTVSVCNALSGWFYRTVFFQAYYVHKGSRPAYGLGRVQKITDQLPEVKELVGNSKFLLIDDVWDEQSALRFIRETIEKINGEGL